MLRLDVVLGSLALLLTACAPTWRSPRLMVDSKDVARALHDTAQVGAPAFDPKTVPNFEAPQKVRPCCAFGVDLKAKVGAVPVPIYENENILSVEEIGPHGYDKGELTREHNGLVYTCRGGFIDLAHVRDTADNTLFLAMHIARALPGGLTIDMPDQGTKRRIVIKALPPGMIERYGRWTIAARMASWVGYQLSIWHEVVTWYGWTSTLGISEKLSAFSPEDLYSNMLGANIAAGIILEREAGSREQYDEAMQGWIREALRRLGVVPKAQARLAMKAVDGLWWDSNKRLPDWKLVTRRYMQTAPPLPPWLVAEALPPDRQSPEVAKMCQGQPPTLELEIEEKLGKTKMEDLIEIRYEFAKWIPEEFPLPASKGQVVRHSDLAVIVEDVRRRASEELGAGFDDPKANAGPKVEEEKGKAEEKKAKAEEKGKGEEAEAKAEEKEKGKGKAEASASAG